MLGLGFTMWSGMYGGGGGATEPSRYWDFTTGDYSHPIGSHTSSPSSVLNSSLDYEAFGADELKRTDLGLMVEPAGAGAMLHNITLTNSVWGKDSGTTVASLGAVGPIGGQNAYRATVASGNGRLAQNNVALVAGQTRRLFAICKPVGSYKFAYFRTDMAATLNTLRNYVFDIELGIAKFQGAGSANAGVLQLSDGWVMVYLDLVTGFSGAGHNFYFGISDVEITSNTFAPPSGAGAFDVAMIDHALSADNESLMLSGASAASRSADYNPLPLGTKPKDLVFTFGDDTTQTIAGVTGDYAIPTDLNRRRIKTALWGEQAWDGLIWTEGDSLMDGAYGHSVHVDLAALVSPIDCVDTSAGGSTMQQQSDRVTSPANASYRPRTLIWWDGSHNEYGTVDAYVGLMEDGVQVLGHPQFVIIPPINPYGSTYAGSVQEAIAAAMQARWPNQFLHWNTFLTNASNAIDATMFEDPGTDNYHLSALGTSQAAQGIFDFLNGKGWL